MRKLVAGMALLAAATASGGIEHTILHGVSVAHVRTWVGPANIPGFSADALRADAESALASAGIGLDSRSQADLVISVTVLAESGSCFVTLQGRLVEPAKLDRNGHAVDAVSWERGGTVVAPAESCAQPTRRLARSAVADFVEHYRAMNPTR